MKRFLMTAVVVCVALGSVTGAKASLVVIPVANHSFEAHVLTDGQYLGSNTTAWTGWTSVNHVQSSLGLWNPQNGSFSGTTGSTIPAPGDGHNLITAQSSLQMWKLYQQPDSHTILANQEYTLTTAVGERKDSFVFSSMRISLKAGAHNGTALATMDLVKQDLDDESVIRGNLHDFAISFNSADYAGQVGQSLFIVYEAYEITGGQVHFDNVRLSVTPIPEPASGVTLLIGAAGMLLKRRRRA